MKNTRAFSQGMFQAGVSLLCLGTGIFHLYLHHNLTISVSLVILGLLNGIYSVAHFSAAFKK